MPALQPLTVGMVEKVVDDIRDLLQQTLNNYITFAYQEAPNQNINLQLVEFDRFYVSDGITPLQPPAVFIFPDESEHDLMAQNILAQRHTIFVALLAEDLEVQDLQRKVWRYAKALWLTLHDQALGDAKILVRRVSYGPTVRIDLERAGQRAFHKDVVLRCEVLHYESMPLVR